MFLKNSDLQNHIYIKYIYYIDMHKESGVDKDNSRSWSTNWRSLGANMLTHEWLIVSPLN